jgi:hypothetical protein
LRSNSKPGKAEQKEKKVKRRERRIEKRRFKDSQPYGWKNGLFGGLLHVPALFAGDSKC